MSSLQAYWTLYQPTTAETLEQLSIEERQVLAHLCKTSLGDFVIAAWHVLEPNTPLRWNWHLDVLCDHVQSILEGPDAVGRLPRTGLPRAWTQNALINVPPGTMKSLVVSVFAVAWKWLKTPSWKVLCASGNPRVMTRDSLKCRDLVKSEWYQELFKPRWGLAADQDQKTLFKNSQGGFRAALGAGGAVTGERGDCLQTDDPNDAQAIFSKAHRETVNDRWWDSAFANRVNDPELSTRIVIMQRLHEEDLTGHILKKEKLKSRGGAWEHLCMQMEYEPKGWSGKGQEPTWLGWTDPRSVPGELLMPHRFSRRYCTEEQTRQGSAGYAGQNQQAPAPAEGNRFLRTWWRFYKPYKAPSWWRPLCLRPEGTSDLPPVELPKAYDEVWESWDFTFKDTDGTDFVCGQKWGRRGADKYLLEVFHERAGLAASVKAVAALHAKAPFASRVLIEDKANGSAVVETFKSRISGIIAVEPMGSKEARAASIEPQVEAGNVYLPDGAEWLGEFIDEFAVFPGGAHDDWIDACSQALIHVSESSDTSAARALCS